MRPRDDPLGKRKAFAADLEAALAAITNGLGLADLAASAERVLRFLGATEGVFGRVDNSAGRVQAVLHRSAAVLPGLVEALTEEDMASLAGRLTPLVLRDPYGMIEGVTPALVPLLPPAALAHLDPALPGAVRVIGPIREDVHDWIRRSRLDHTIWSIGRPGAPHGSGSYVVRLRVPPRWRGPRC